MDDADFDRALIAAAFNLAAERGWHRTSIARAARAGALALDRARLRFPNRAVLLVRFGRMADAAALAGVSEEGSRRDRLFDLLMRRLDMLQQHRAGVLALLRAVPADPCLALLLAAANLRSMRWMLEGAGIGATGPFGTLRAKGLLAVWLWTMRAWQRDESSDLSATMAALDQALSRAETVQGWLDARRPGATPPEPSPDASAAEAPEPSGERPQEIPPAPA
jgi:ubiquinone biosynthesis protein COQ9